MAASPKIFHRLPRLSRIKGSSRQYSERSSVRDPQLPINMVQVDLHCTLGQPKPPPNFLVGYAFGEHEHDLALAGTEWLMRPIS